MVHNGVTWQALGAHSFMLRSSTVRALVNTHAHWDHFFGNAIFKNDGVTDFWAHATTARVMAETGKWQRLEVASLEPVMAAGAGDLMVGVLGELGAAGVLFAGDVLEEGAPASVELESSVPGWAAVLDRLAKMGGKYSIMVPGHGNPVGAEFAATMAVHFWARWQRNS